MKVGVRVPYEKPLPFKYAFLSTGVRLNFASATSCDQVTVDALSKAKMQEVLPKTSACPPAPGAMIAVHLSEQKLRPPLQDRSFANFAVDPLQQRITKNPLVRPG